MMSAYHKNIPMGNRKFTQMEKRGSLFEKIRCSSLKPEKNINYYSLIYQDEFELSPWEKFIFRNFLVLAVQIFSALTWLYCRSL